MTIGITDNGFVTETLDEIRNDIANKLSSRIDSEISRDDTSALWHLITIVADRIDSLQQLALAVYRSYGPDSATGDGLISINAQRGILPIGATKSKVTLTLTGTAGTVVPALSRASDGSTDVVFETLEDATLATIGTRVELTAYVTNVRRVANGNVYLVVAPGVTAAGAGPTGTGDAIADGTVTWRYLGAGGACVDVDAECTQVGPVQALSGELTVDETPVAGWSNVINVLDADLGAYNETDESFRLRGQEALAGAGSHTAMALRADLLRLADVVSVKILENKTDSFVSPMPAHTVEALVRGGDDDEIAQLLLETGVGLGYATYGNTSVTVQDDLNESYTIKFSRPTPIPIYATLAVKVDATQFPADGAEQIELAIVTWGDALASGRDAVASAIAAQAFKVLGVMDASALISTSPTPTLGTTIAVGIRELATYDTSRLIVNVTNVTP